jgi:hypothetical protein
MAPVATNYAQWKDGWLKHPTDNAMGLSKDEAEKVAAGLKGK